MALGVVGANTTSAGFFYKEKGLGTIIMAQTGLVTYMSEFTFAFVSRLGGTLVGGVLGLVGWYIGSGNGPGNPYGLSAVMAVVAVILVWFRLFAPPQFLQAVLLMGATTLLVSSLD